MLAVLALLNKRHGMFDFLTKKKQETTTEEPFIEEAEIIDDVTGKFYTIGRLMPLHIALSKHENEMISSIRIVAMCVKCDNTVLTPEQVSVMPIKLFTKLMGKLAEQL